MAISCRISGYSARMWNDETECWHLRRYWQRFALLLAGFAGYLRSRALLARFACCVLFGLCAIAAPEGRQ